MLCATGKSLANSKTLAFTSDCAYESTSPRQILASERKSPSSSPGNHKSSPTRPILYLGECGKVLVKVFFLSAEQRVVRSFPVGYIPETADIDAHDLGRGDALP